MRDSACFDQSVFQVVDQVVRIFNAHTESDEVFREVALFAHFGINGGVRHLARHADEGVDASKADADAPESAVVHDGLGQGNGVGAEGEHAAGAFGLLVVNVFARVAWQAGIEDREAKTVKELGDALGVGLLSVHA